MFFTIFCDKIDYFLYKANKQYESLTREYLSNIHIDELDSPALSARNRAK